MHWRTPFPPKRASVLAELIVVMPASLHPDKTMTPETTAELPDELPPAAEPGQLLTSG
jgi:hypothetical protein